MLADNHNAHHFSGSRALFHANGHLLINGSIHSPDFAPAEWGFSHATTFATHYSDWMRSPPADYPQVFAAGLRSLTPEYMSAYFTDAHFLVPGLPYKPYLGN